MTVTQLIYLITGANRGIGRYLTADILLRPSTTVIAAVRDVHHETSISLFSLPLAQDSKLHVIAVDETQPQIGSVSLRERLRSLGFDHLDIVVSNAGGSSAFRTVLEARPEELASDYSTNVLAPLGLFQACWPLLQASDGSDPRCKKFVYVSSSTGSIGVQAMEHYPSTGYGASKAAGNWLAVAIALGHKQDGLKTGIFHPGFANTALGKKAASALGSKEEPPMTAAESATALLRHIDTLDSEGSGTFDSFHGRTLPW